MGIRWYRSLGVTWDTHRMGPWLGLIRLGLTCISGEELYLVTEKEDQLRRRAARLWKRSLSRLFWSILNSVIQMIIFELENMLIFLLHLFSIFLQHRFNSILLAWRWFAPKKNLNHNQNFINCTALLRCKREPVGVPHSGPRRFQQATLKMRFRTGSTFLVPGTKGS